MSEQILEVVYNRIDEICSLIKPNYSTSVAYATDQAERALKGEQ